MKFDARRVESDGEVGVLSEVDGFIEPDRPSQLKWKGNG